MKRTVARILAGVTMASAVWVGGISSAGATTIGDTEGCTPGYWKNHTEAWEEYTPERLLNTLWAIPPELRQFRTMTMLQALQGGGGNGLDGAAKILLRAAVASYLNAAHDGIEFPYRRFQDPFNIKDQVLAALWSLDRDTMLDLAATLDSANNLGCPLN